MRIVYMIALTFFLNDAPADHPEDRTAIDTTVLATQRDRKGVKPVTSMEMCQEVKVAQRRVLLDAIERSDSCVFYPRVDAECVARELPEYKKQRK